MPKAIIGSKRVIIGGWPYRISVSDDVFDKTIQELERTPLRSMGGIDPCVAGGFRAGHVRAGVLLPLFDAAIEALERTPTPNRALIGGRAIVVGGKDCRVGVFTEDWARAVSRFEG